MSSIRPLATITVLALVGVFLYMKINETEPPLPEGVEDWAVGTELEFDMGGGAPAAAPQVAMSGGPGDAPAFVAEKEPAVPAAGDVAPAFTSSASEAPSWSETPTADAAPAAPPAAPPAEVATAPAYETNPADVAEPTMPELPPLPTLPAATTAPVAETTADAPLPDMPSEPMPSEPAVSESPAAAPPEMTAATEPTPPPAASPTTEPTTTEPTTTAPTTTAPTTTEPTTTATTSADAPAGSPFAAARASAQEALDRGELSQALLLLSDWYGDPTLTPSESRDLNLLLSQLAGSVIYSTEHRIEKPYMVQSGERLETIAQQYNVPWQLLAKINGLSGTGQLQPGQELKVVRGPFSALIDISQQKLTLMLDRRYAGQFALNIDPQVTVEEGHWEVNQKLLTPANVGLPGAGPTTPTEERSLMLSSTAGAAKQVAILRGSAQANSLAEPTQRVLRLSPNDAAEVFDILSLGSKVVIRR